MGGHQSKDEKKRKPRLQVNYDGSSIDSDDMLKHENVKKHEKTDQCIEEGSKMLKVFPKKKIQENKSRTTPSKGKMATGYTKKDIPIQPNNIINEIGDNKCIPEKHNECTLPLNTSSYVEKTPTTVRHVDALKIRAKFQNQISNIPSLNTVTYISQKQNKVHQDNNKHLVNSKLSVAEIPQDVKRDNTSLGTSSSLQLNSSRKVDQVDTCTSSSLNTKLGTENNECELKSKPLTSSQCIQDTARTTDQVNNNTLNVKHGVEAKSEVARDSKLLNTNVQIISSSIKNINSEIPKNNTLSKNVKALTNIIAENPQHLKPVKVCHKVNSKDSATISNEQSINNTIGRNIHKVIPSKGKDQTKCRAINKVEPKVFKLGATNVKKRKTSNSMVKTDVTNKCNDSSKQIPESNNTSNMVTADNNALTIKPNVKYDGTLETTNISHQQESKTINNRQSSLDSSVSKYGAKQEKYPKSNVDNIYFTKDVHMAQGIPSMIEKYFNKNNTEDELLVGIKNLSSYSLTEPLCFILNVGKKSYLDYLPEKLVIQKQIGKYQPRIEFHTENDKETSSIVLYVKQPQNKVPKKPCLNLFLEMMEKTQFKVSLKKMDTKKQKSLICLPLKLHALFAATEVNDRNNEANACTLVFDQTSKLLYSLTIWKLPIHFCEEANQRIYMAAKISIKSMIRKDSTGRKYVCVDSSLSISTPSAPVGTWIFEEKESGQHYQVTHCTKNGEIVVIKVSEVKSGANVTKCATVKESKKQNSGSSISKVNSRTDVQEIHSIEQGNATNNMLIEINNFAETKVNVYPRSDAINTQTKITTHFKKKNKKKKTKRRRRKRNVRVPSYVAKLSEEIIQDRQVNHQDLTIIYEAQVNDYANVKQNGEVNKDLAIIHEEQVKDYAGVNLEREVGNEHEDKVKDHEDVNQDREVSKDLKVNKDLEIIHERQVKDYADVNQDREVNKDLAIIHGGQVKDYADLNLEREVSKDLAILHEDKVKDHADVNQDREVSNDLAIIHGNQVKDYANLNKDSRFKYNKAIAEKSNVERKTKMKDNVNIKQDTEVKQASEVNKRKQIKQNKDVIPYGQVKEYAEEKDMESKKKDANPVEEKCNDNNFKCVSNDIDNKGSDDQEDWDFNFDSDDDFTWYSNKYDRTLGSESHRYISKPTDRLVKRCKRRARNRNGKVKIEMTSIIDVRFCDSCGKATHPPYFPCKLECGTHFYCAVKCLNKHWPIHKKECRKTIKCECGKIQ